MNWNDILVAFISCLGACIGTIYGIHKSSSLTIYRIDQLEKKVELHNNLVERMTVSEHRTDALQKTADKFNERIASHGEQIDQVYTLAEKNESRIQMLERLANR